MTGTPTGLHRPRRAADRAAAVHAQRRRAPGPRWASASPPTRPILDPATGELVTAEVLHQRGTAGDWVQVVSLDRRRRASRWPRRRRSSTTGAGRSSRSPPASGRVVRTTAAHPFLTDQGWRPLAELAAGTRIAVRRPAALLRPPAAAGRRGVAAGHYLGDGGLRHADDSARDEAVLRCRSMDLDGLALLRRHGLFHADDRTMAAARRPSPACPAQQLLRSSSACSRPTARSRPDRPAPVSFVARSEALVRSSSTCSCASAWSTSLHAVRDQHRGAERTVHALVVESASRPRRRCRRRRSASACPSRSSPPPGAARRRHRRSGGGRPCSTTLHRPGRPAAPDVCWDEIVAITAAGDEQVYDLTVPGPGQLRRRRRRRAQHRLRPRHRHPRRGRGGTCRCCSSRWRWATPS